MEFKKNYATFPFLIFVSFYESQSVDLYLSFYFEKVLQKIVEKVFFMNSAK